MNTDTRTPIFRVTIIVAGRPDYTIEITAPDEWKARTRAMLAYPHKLTGNMVEYRVRQVNTPTFEEFQATRTWCENLAAAIGTANWADDANVTPKGNLYLNCLFIEAVQPHWPAATRAAGAWYLLIANMEWISNDLTALEQRLYDWAICEGYTL